MNGWSDEEFMQNMVYKPFNFLKGLIKSFIVTFGLCETSQVRRVQRRVQKRDTTLEHAKEVFNSVKEEDTSCKIQCFVTKQMIMDMNALGWKKYQYADFTPSEIAEIIKNQVGPKKPTPQYEVPYSNFCGVERIGDLDDYEYSSDGKRMCFVNYQSGNVVYSGDALFSKLKNRMLYGG